MATHRLFLLGASSLSDNRQYSSCLFMVRLLLGGASHSPARRRVPGMTKDENNAEFFSLLTKHLVFFPNRFASSGHASNKCWTRGCEFKLFAYRPAAPIGIHFRKPKNAKMPPIRTLLSVLRSLPSFGLGRLAELADAPDSS